MENMEKNRYTWNEVRNIMYKFNEDNGYTVKGTEKKLWAVAVITADSFDKEYSETERSYKFSSDNKAFIKGQLSNSIFSSCLDGIDCGVRLDFYIPNTWKVEYCYFVEDDK